MQTAHNSEACVACRSPVPRIRDIRGSRLGGGRLARSLFRGQARLRLDVYSQIQDSWTHVAFLHRGFRSSKMVVGDALVMLWDLGREHYSKSDDAHPPPMCCCSSRCQLVPDRETAGLLQLTSIDNHLTTPKSPFRLRSTASDQKTRDIHIIQSPTSVTETIASHVW